MGQFSIGLTIIAFAAALGWFGTQVATEGWKNWKHPNDVAPNGISEINQDIYKLSVTSTIRSKFPGPLLYVYRSQLGDTISPINLAFFLEVVNNKSTISRIYSIETRALMSYDEGGVTKVVPQPSGGNKVTYEPSGKITEQWRTLHSVGFLHDQIYFVAENDWTKCKRIDFTNNGFENQAKNKQLKAGESLMGWVFYELEPDLRTQLPEIKQLEFSLKNSAGETQVIRVNYPKEGESFPSISSGAWEIQAGYYDLSKKHYSLCPKIDLHDAIKRKTSNKSK